MSARYIAVTLGAVLFSFQALAADTTTNANFNGYSPNPCQGFINSLDVIQKSGATAPDLLSQGLSCRDKANKAPSPTAGTGHDVESDASAATKKSSSAMKKWCTSQIQGTPDNCAPFMADKASKLQKQARDDTKDLQEAQQRSLEAGKNCQKAMQEITDHQDQQKLAISTTLPAEHNQQVLTANQAYRDELVKMNDRFTNLQTQYTQAQADYNDAVGLVRSSCYDAAVKAYQDQKKAINGLKTGGGVNVSSSRLVTLENSLKTYQSRKYQECLSGVSGTAALQKAATALANKKTQLSQQNAALNVERGNDHTQLATSLAKIETEYKAKLNAAGQALMQDNAKIMQQRKSCQAEANINNQTIQDLQKQIAQEKETEACIEASTGTATSDDDSDNSTNLRSAFVAATSLAAGCWNYNEDGTLSNPQKASSCPACNGVPHFSVDQYKVYNHVPASSATTPPKPVGSSSRSSTSSGSAAQ